MQGHRRNSNGERGFCYENELANLGPRVTEKTCKATDATVMGREEGFASGMVGILKLRALCMEFGLCGLGFGGLGLGLKV